ncbi:MAG: hypothetical protein P8Z41_09435 [Anaerolineales bacterium]
MGRRSSGRDDPIVSVRAYCPYAIIRALLLTEVKTMEQEQIEKRLEWLDETRRKDADAISRLMERMSNIEESVNKQVHQGQDMSEELTRLKALAARINQFDDTLVQHRKEVSKQLKDAEERIISAGNWMILSPMTTCVPDR